MLAACVLLHVIAPVLGALFNIFFRKFGRIQFCLTLITLLSLVGGSVFALFHTFDMAEYSYTFGGWTVPFGIEFKLTLWNSIFLLLISAVALLTFLYGYRHLTNEMSQFNRALFNSLFLICILGLYGVVMTNDFFNLYVFLELSSIAVYALISWNLRDKQASSAAFYYLIAGSVASVFFLIGVGYLYNITGTLNITHNLVKLKTINNTKVVYLGSCLIALGLLIKSAVFPMHGWILKVYGHTNSFILPFLSGTSNKIYFYVFVKLFLLGFFNFGFIHYFLFFSAIIMIVWFSIYAFKEQNMRVVLLLSSMIQIGYVLLLLAVGGENLMLLIVSILLSHSLAAVALMMLISNGTTLLPYNFILFIINALSLVGFPATLGFVPKLWLLQNLFDQHKFGLFGFIIFTFFLTFAYLFKSTQTLVVENNLNSRRYIFSFEDAVVMFMTIFNIGMGIFALNFVRLL